MLSFPQTAIITFDFFQKPHDFSLKIWYYLFAVAPCPQNAAQTAGDISEKIYQNTNLILPINNIFCYNVLDTQQGDNIFICDLRRILLAL